jgi:hypothetical protein
LSIKADTPNAVISRVEEINDSVRKNMEAVGA